MRQEAVDLPMNRMRYEAVDLPTNRMRYEAGHLTNRSTAAWNSSPHEQKYCHVELVTSRTEWLTRPRAKYSELWSTGASLCHLLVLLQGHHLGHLIVGVEVVRVQGDPLATEGLLVTRGLSGRQSDQWTNLRTKPVLSNPGQKKRLTH